MSRKIAEERIQKLFELADKRLRGDQKEKELADRYVEIALKIGMSYNVSIPGELRRRYCHYCKSFLKPGYNSKVRIDSKKSNINYECGECGEVNRYGF